MKTLHQGDCGADVKRLQRLLLKNRYGSFDCGPVDGQFGPRTAAACHEAKWALGYRRGHCRPTAGELLLAILAGTKALTAAQRTRRQVRRRRADRQPLRARALAIGLRDVGLREQPGNRIKYTEWWGWPTAYCVIALMYWYAEAGSRTTPRMKGTLAGCNTDALLAAALAGRWGLRVVATPLPGDMGVLDFDGHRDPDHGLLCIALEGDQAKTLEANTTIGDGTEGVAIKYRPRRNCWWVRVPS